MKPLTFSLIAALICGAIYAALGNWGAVVASVGWAQAAYGWRYERGRRERKSDR